MTTSCELVLVCLSWWQAAVVSSGTAPILRRESLLEAAGTIGSELSPRDPWVKVTSKSATHESLPDLEAEYGPDGFDASVDGVKLSDAGFKKRLEEFKANAKNARSVAREHAQAIQRRTLKDRWNERLYRLARHSRETQGDSDAAEARNTRGEMDRSDMVDSMDSIRHRNFMESLEREQRLRTNTAQQERALLADAELHKEITQQILEREDKYVNEASVKQNEARTKAIEKAKEFFDSNLMDINKSHEDDKKAALEDAEQRRKLIFDALKKAEETFGKSPAGKKKGGAKGAKGGKTKGKR